jgi:hypothetical protein
MFSTYFDLRAHKLALSMKAASAGSRANAHQLGKTGAAMGDMGAMGGTWRAGNRIGEASGIIFGKPSAKITNQTINVVEVYR